MKKRAWHLEMGDEMPGRSGNTLHGRVEVLVDEEAGLKAETDLCDLVRRAAEAALNAEHTAGPDSVEVLLTNDHTLRSLNLQFKGEDSVTDVLSFNDIEGWHDGAPPAELTPDVFLAPGEKPRLGEIAISLEQSRRQADQRSVPFERELAMLTIHGVLHLLGYDHADPEEERVMFGKTDAVLAQVFGR